jgi:hypothetical protein
MDTFIIVLIVILVLVYLGQKVFLNEEFKIADSLTLYIFLSSNCPACQMYLNNKHYSIRHLAKYYGIELKTVQSDGSTKSNNLFAKFDVQSVPTPIAILVKDNKIYKNFGSSFNYDSINAALEPIFGKDSKKKNDPNTTTPFFNQALKDFNPLYINN